MILIWIVPYQMMTSIKLKKIKEILNEGREFNKKVVSKDEALNLFKENKYKLELINNLIMLQR